MGTISRMAAKPPSPPAPGPSRNGPGGKPKPPVSPFAQFRSFRFWVTLGIVLAANILISNFLFQTPQPKSVTIAYSTFIDQVTADNVVSITSVGTTITGTSKQAVKDVNGKDTAKNFTTEIPVYAGTTLEPLLDQHHVT
jgi:FtsH Extracellular